MVLFQIMETSTYTLALISEVYPTLSDANCLTDHLRQAKQVGATLAVLPELPLNPWSPATQSPHDDDAEGFDGERCAIQKTAARDASIGLIGGAIIRDATTGTRLNTALIINEQGDIVGTYRKAHLPQEPGFWETSHYEPGHEPAEVFTDFGLPFGVQICSDANRPEGTHILSAMGAELVIVPRSTELATYERWKTVFRANAITSCLYVASVNRPHEEQGVKIGGPSVVVDPNGEIIVETTDRIIDVTIDRDVVQDARRKYPGYLPVRTDIYLKGWASTEKRNRN